MQKLALRFGLAKIKWLALADRFGQRIIDQRIQRIAPKQPKHVLHFLRRWANMAAICKVIRQVVGWGKRHETLQFS